MRIVFLRHSLLSRGGDKMIVAHASYLAAQGHEVIIKTNRCDTVFALDPRVRVEKLPFSGMFGSLLSAATLKHDADWVIADIIPLIPLLRLRNGGRVLYFAQDYDESYYQFSLQKLFIRLLYCLALTACRTKTVAVSEPLARQLRERFSASVSVAENGVDASAFFYDPDPDLIAAKKGRKAVVLLSRSDPRKGFDLALKVAEMLKEQVGEVVEIWTVGEKAEGRISGFTHHDFGYLREDRLRQVFSSADMFLYPSRHEGYPLMVLEAFACRCPVVTTTAVPYAQEGINALVCEIGDVAGLADKLLRLCGDMQLRQALVVEGARLADRQILSRTLSLFAAELGGAAGDRHG